jgi:hypothetical protein
MFININMTMPPTSSTSQESLLSRDDFIQIIESIDITPILEYYHSIESDIKWTNYGHKGKQAGIQYLAGQDPWSGAVGRSQGKELEYDQLNPYFAGTIFEQIVDKFKFKRTRLMWVGSNSCYSMHTDSTPRVHIPLITNPECYFVFKNGVPSHLATGFVWYTNTTLPHTFMNCSEYPRLHLVGAIEK